MTDVPLFGSHDVISFTIQAPLKSIFDERSQESEEFPGMALLPKPGGDTVSLNVDVRTRGKSRLQKRVCRFPPLRLDFPKDSVGGTLFEGQNKIKLVTHCRSDREEYEQYVLLEYLIYRTYNLLTEKSFRVRLADITYIDTEGDRDTVTRHGFLIEDEEMMAERNGEEYLEVSALSPMIFDPFDLALLEVFQYFIGNTDYSAFMSEPEKDECCHNTKPIGTGAGPVYSVPYDFDMSGLVKTRYANRLFRGNLERFDLRSVRERLYRGWCNSQAQWPAVFDLFNQKREEIYALYRQQEGLEPDVLEDTLEYIDDFYEVINDEGKIRREFENECRRF